MRNDGKQHELKEPDLEKEAVRLDRQRVRNLRSGALFAAARASILLAVALARLGRLEHIPAVIEDLRRTVRQARRHAEVVFALYYVTNAMARGEDLDEAAAEGMARLRRCRRRKPNSSSGANDGAGAFKRRRSMKTQQMVQELKSERVQEEMATEEPFRVFLKSERVQEPAALAGAGEETSTFLELVLPQPQPVTIELQALQIVITLHGTTAVQAG